jgi:hypothetical protein
MTKKKLGRHPPEKLRSPKEKLRLLLALLPPHRGPHCQVSGEAVR